MCKNEKDGADENLAAAESTCEPQEQKLRKLGAFGIEIGGWGSALALILVIVSLVWQGWSFLRGADVQLIPIRSVELACSYPTDGQCTADSDLIVVIDGFAAVNFGGDGYDVLIDPGVVKVDFKDSNDATLRSVALQAQFLSDRSTSGIKQVSVSRLYLKGGTSGDFQKNIEYWPRYIVLSDGKVDRQNFMNFEEFKTILEEGVDDVQVTLLQITISPKLFGRNRDEPILRCMIQVDDRMRKSAADPEVGSFPRDCTEVQIM